MMDYFIVTCGEYTKPPRGAGLDKLASQKLLNKQQAQEFDDISVINISSPSEEGYADIIASPIFLVSDEMKGLFVKYDNTLVCKAVRLVDRDSNKQLLYWIIGLEALDCLSEETVFYPNRTLKHLVLDQTKIGKSPIFTLSGVLEKDLIVRLDVAESLLRRSFYGIELKKISVVTKEAH